MSRVGVVGLGTMGRGIASRLVETGLRPVAVHTRSGAEPTGGWTIHGTVASLGRSCDVVLLTVPTAAAFEETLAGEAGLLAALGEDAVLVNVATVGPEKAVQIGGLVEDAGFAYLDAPVLGSKGAAASGALTILAAGGADARNRCADIFSAMGKRTIEFDDVGARAKPSCSSTRCWASAWQPLSKLFAWRTEWGWTGSLW